ncbi:MAG TPA: hypothetical protein DCM40_36955 [Maribacter sp.]|nr:hypothetical protein [Maribacter sp.]
MISSFKQYLVEETKTVYFTWGRMNPPTMGHGKLLDTLLNKARSNPYRIFVTQSNDPKSNPLKYMEKVKMLRKLFPRHARSIMSNKKIKTVFHALTSLYDEGFKNVVMVVGSDRVIEFNTLLKKYNGKKSTHGFYNFQSIKVISAGERDPDAQGVTGISASKMRYYATKSDFTSFSQGLPKNVSNSDAKILYNMVRRGMGLKEEKLFKRHLQLESISNDRENYIRGNLFNEGDDVVIKNNDEVAKIIFCGSNYVIIETSDGLKLRKWLGDVSRIDEAPRYYGGVHRKREDIAKASAERLKQQTKRREALNKEAEMDIERAKKMRRKTADG